MESKLQSVLQLVEQAEGCRALVDFPGGRVDYELIDTLDNRRCRDCQFFQEKRRCNPAEIPVQPSLETALAINAVKN